MTSTLRVIAAVAAAMTLAAVGPPVAVADPGADSRADLAPGPPYVDHVEWAKWGDLSSLRVFPTHAARITSTRSGTDAQAGEAWSEVLGQSPDAAIPGMFEQFICHWRFAELVEPGKTSWNLEPWRPEVSADQMMATGCNPGGTEEPF